jgi:photosystem II stability/assembly factor-like uncharacterized protein
MIDKDLQRVKISQVIGTQLPNFVSEENPYFAEFLKQYYISQEYLGGPTDLAENIDQYVNFDNFLENTLLDGDSTLSTNIEYYDDEIEVSSTVSWPDSYGLLKIDNEIITYTSKDSTKFYGCIRGFSGVENLHQINNEEHLVFSSSNADSHSLGVKVFNLSNLFLKEFWYKLKKHVLPGFEDRDFYSGISKKLFLSRAKDFYKSKGTDESIKILFKVLYGEANAQIIKPQEYLIKPSNAEWLVTNNIVAEIISGDPTKIKGSTVFQDSPKAFGYIYDTQFINTDDGTYYRLKLSLDSTLGDFTICPSTTILKNIPVNGTTITVDSTIGFENSGELYINAGIVTYTFKNSTQFLNCVGVTTSFSIYTKVYQNNFAYTYENNDSTKPVYLRINAQLNKNEELIEAGKYLKVGDEIPIRSFGEEVLVGSNNLRFDYWLYNLNYEVEVQNKNFGVTNTGTPSTINTKQPHGFKINDDITLIDTQSGEQINGSVNDIISANSFVFVFSGNLSQTTNYIARKNIKLASSTYGHSNISNYVADIQNTYIDRKGEYLYVATSGLPSYPITAGVPVISNTKYFSIGAGSTDTVTISNHNLYSGDKVVFDSNSNPVTGISSGIYYVKKLTDNTIQFAYSPSRIYLNDVLIFSGGNGTSNYKIVKEEVNNKVLGDQRILKKFPITPKPKTKDFTIKTGPVGMFLNGVEILSSQFTDSVYYGQLESVDVLAGGKKYDVLNPPNLIIYDSVGSGATGNVCLTGSITDIILTNPGYDYKTTPIITITGGNGSGATAEAKLRSSLNTIKISTLTGVNTATNIIGFSTYHKFQSGEEVIYETLGNTAIGIGTDGSENLTEYLIDKSSYFVIKNNDLEISLSNRKSDAFVGINTINLVYTGTGSHQLTSRVPRRIIDKIFVTNPGEGYSNARIDIPSQIYPPLDYKLVKTALVGINTLDNYIFAKNHGFSSGDLINYETTGTSITGLNTSQNYHIIKIDNDKFKLAVAGIGTTATDVNYRNNIYVKFYDVGIGTHTFKYPPISLSITGASNIPDISGISSSLYSNITQAQATAIPIVKGSVRNIFITTPGSSYGTSEILNFHRKPLATISSGSGAVLRAIVSNGSIDQVYILNAGYNYTSTPKIYVTGTGKYAELLPIVSNGRIVSVTIINSGVEYDSTIELDVVSEGVGCVLSPNVQLWNVSTYKKNEAILTNPNNDDDGLIIEAFNKNLDSSQLVSPVVPRALRYVLEDNIDQFYDEVGINTVHSPIVGWAYDGNPIYGPYGGKNPKTVGNVKGLLSSYTLVSKPNRPNYPLGFFIEDYEYTASGDLDEFNGRYCVTPEFPNGTYAYFATLNQYPYVLLPFKNEAESFNYDFSKTQSTLDILQDSLLRNVTPYKLNQIETKYYGFIEIGKNKEKSKLEAIYTSGITSVRVSIPGTNYQVGDKLIFNNNESGGRGADAQVYSILGRDIQGIGYTTNIIDGIEFTYENNLVTGITSIPHNLSNNDLVTISGISTYSFKSFEGTYNIGVSSIKTTLAANIGLVGVTGLTTYISLYEHPLTGKIGVNDVIGIGTEKLLVLDFNTYLGTYRVSRAYDSTLGLAHTAGDVVYVDQRKFTYNISGLSTDKPILANKTTYFNPVESVGLGNTITRVLIGYGVSEITLGIQTGQGSYTRLNFNANPFKTGDYVQVNATSLNIAQASVVSASSTSAVIDYNSTGAVGVGSTGIVILRKLNSINDGCIFIPGHNYQTGQILKYSYGSGTGLVCSNNSTLTPTFTLADNQLVYAVKIDNDNIGIVTTAIGIGSTSKKLYFTSSATGNSHSFTATTNNVTGSLNRIRGYIDTLTDHNLNVEDTFDLTLIPNNTETVICKYDNVNSKLLINPVSFGSTQIGIGSTLSYIQIPSHNFNTGDKVLYTSSTPAGGLINNNEYYIVKIDNNSVKLSDSYYNSNKLDYVYVPITSAVGTNHILSPINPKLEFYKGNIASFLVSDSSLQNLKLNFYSDYYFRNQAFDNNITRINSSGAPNAAVNILLNENIPQTFYYRLDPVGINTISNNANSITIDKDTINYGKIILKNSLYNDSYSVVGLTSTRIHFNLNKIPENNYSVSGVSTVKYVTTSNTAYGPINRIKVNFGGVGYKSIPGISTIISEIGNGAILKPFSADIGKIKEYSINSPGFNLPTDKTLSPKADIPITLKIVNNFKFKSISIVSGGKNYITPPAPFVIGNSSAKLQAYLIGSSVNNVIILNNSSGFTEIGPRIIPVNNTNGIRVIAATSNSGTNTLSLKAPTNGFTVFPFNVGDKIYVEGIVITDSYSGYNSENYDYALFTITSRVTTQGSETISYSIAGIGNSGGTYDAVNSVGRVIKSSDLAIFQPVMEQSDFFDNEPVFIGIQASKVSPGGWDKTRRILKVSSKVFYPLVGDIISGSLSETKGTIEEVVDTNFNYNIGPSVKINNNFGWLTDSGLLNTSTQKIQDSEYYQNFSYSIKSTIPRSTWEEPVNSLVHSVGFKNFSDLIVNTRPTLGIGRSNNLKVSIGSSTLSTLININSVASLYTRFVFDYASEETTNQGVSKYINLQNIKLTNYSICNTNKALVIDNISNQFTGIGSYGSISGISSFSIKNLGDPLLYKVFDSTNLNTVSAGSSVIYLPNHDFSTGEELYYDPGPGGSYISIASTDRTLAGISTTKLPNTVFAYKVNSNIIKLSGIKTDSTTNNIFFTFNSFSGVGSTVGAGQTHSLSTSYVDANSRSLILIDGIVQSPLYRKKVSTSLSQNVGFADTTISLTGITSISSNTLLQIESEILKVNVVGFGSTNVLTVDRGIFGTSAKTHAVGVAITVLGGDYTINQGTLYFSTPPYGPVGVSTLQPGISTNSTFTGRIFYRLDYKENFILDDISTDFNGSKKFFTLTSNNIDATGIVTNTTINYGIFLINNIIQQPTIDYNIAEKTSPGIGASITFTGTNSLSIPRGGVIERVTAKFGAGYQSISGAFANAVVSSGGTIQSVGLTTGGSGYRNAPIVSIADTLGGGSGASIIALLGSGLSSGIITGFNIVNGGVGYAQTNPPLVKIGIPTEYSNLNLIGGSGSGSKADIKIGVGGSVIGFTITDFGFGYKPNDVLTITGIPVVTGIGTSAFTLTINSVFSDKFVGWTFGQIDRLDSFTPYFNGIRKAFNLTKTNVVTEDYSINAAPGTDINPANNLIIIINDVIQQPGRDYTFIGGTQVTFTEAPKSGSKCQVLFYKGSSADATDVNIVPTVKVGDFVKLNQKPPYVDQLTRTVERISKLDQIETIYYDVGISTDLTANRILSWTKQTNDVILNNEILSKSRTNYEVSIKPSSRLIKNVNTTDLVIYVENAFPFFRQLDDTLQIDNSIKIINDIYTESAKATVSVSAASTIINAEISNGGIGYTATSLPNVSVASTIPQIREVGKTWNIGIITTTALSYKDIEFDGSIYVAVSDAGYISTSFNFTQWITTNESPYDLTSVGFGANTWAVLGKNGTVLTSYDSKNWSNSAVFLSRVSIGSQFFQYQPISPFTANLFGITFGKNKFVAVGAAGTALISEYGQTGIGTAWIVKSTTISNTLNSISFGSQTFVAVGDNGKIVTSSDGYVWNQAVSSSSITVQNLYHVKYIVDKFIAVGENGTVIYSYDGNIWYLVGTGVTTRLYGVNYYEGVYVITGQGGLTLNSTSGTYWNIRPTSTTSTINRFIPYNNGLVGVGTAARYYYTTPVISRPTIVPTVSAAGTISNLSITEPGFGYNYNSSILALIGPPPAIHETIDNVDVDGDFGLIVGIGTSATGIGTNTPIVKFNFSIDARLNTLKYGFIARSKIGVGDYFVVKNSIVGRGVTSLNSTTGYSTLGIGSTFIDTVYRADEIINDGISGIVTVYSNVRSISGIGSTSFATSNCGSYSWGKLYNFSVRSAPRQFNVNLTMGLIGISSAPLVVRDKNLNEKYIIS